MSNLQNSLLRTKGVALFLGVSIPTVWRWVAEGRLPRPIKLTARCSVWRREWLEDFVNERGNGHHD